MNIKRLIRGLKLLTLLPKNIYFNFKNLPLKQAVKLPIILNKGKIINRGELKIEGPISFGMIRLGFFTVSLYPDSGCLIENKGKIIFQGDAHIGNAAAISVGESGTLIIGKDLISTTSLKIACYDKITLSKDVHVGWDVKITDTDFHAITRPDGRKTKGYGPIFIGEGAWLASGVKIYKKVTIPPFCIVGADTIVHRSPDCEEKTIITSSGDGGYKYAKGWRNYKDDVIQYGQSK